MKVTTVLVAMVMVTLAAVLPVSTVHADNVAVVNPSFESQTSGKADGWDCSSTWNWMNVPASVTDNLDGSMCAAFSEGRWITQSVDAVAGQQYTLTVGIESWAIWADSAVPSFCSYNISMSNGGSTIASAIGQYSAVAGILDPANPHFGDWGYWVYAENHFGDITITGTATTTGPLTITLSNNSSWVFYDNVRMTTTPEPATMSLLIVGGLLALRRRHSK